MRHLATSHCVAPSPMTVTTALAGPSLGLSAKSTRQGLFCQGLKHPAKDGHVSDRPGNLPTMMTSTNRPFGDHTALSDSSHVGAGSCHHVHQAHGLAA